ncbi:MAG: flagellar export chaperone FlgN [Planctomycetota bacterium]|jgi:flagellar biosynthesis/type III secretory pathway chaperone
MKRLDELLQLLDEQVDLLQQKLSTMRRMRECVATGESTVLGELLRQEADLMAGGDALEQRLKEMKEQIAEELAVPLGRVSLGRLAASLGSAEAMALDDRRERLLVAVRQLQEESAATARLVRHALEFNNQLLAALVGIEQSCTYSPSGTVEAGCEKATFQHSA